MIRQIEGGMLDVSASETVSFEVMNSLTTHLVVRLEKELCFLIRQHVLLFALNRCSPCPGDTSTGHRTYFSEA
ncbi:MAG: hypothetical protein KAR37_09850 [Alphaproteobacteria bacterium]|nr:hypothetical protein [Alphaproteobacteria bacterium]